MSEILEQLRQAVEESGESRYAISKATGIDQGNLSKLMNGQGGLGLSNIEALADHLGLEIVIRSKRRIRKGR